MPFGKLTYSDLTHLGELDAQLPEEELCVPAWMHQQAPYTGHRKVALMTAAEAALAALGDYRRS